MADKEQTSTKPTMQNKNAAGGMLALFSKDPPTGYYRDGYCRTGKEDSGNHSIAATVSDQFLDFTAKKGNNLQDAGVKPGMKWCLCAHRWQEAYDAFKSGDLSKEAVPKVFLHATHENALKTVSYKTLKEFAEGGEAGTQTNRQQSHIDPEKPSSSVSGSGAKETKDFSRDRLAQEREL